MNQKKELDGGLVGVGERTLKKLGKIEFVFNSSSLQIKLEILKELYREVSSFSVEKKEELLFFLIKLFFEDNSEESRAFLRKFIFKLFPFPIKSELTKEDYLTDFSSISSSELLYFIFTYGSYNNLIFFLKKGKLKSIWEVTKKTLDSSSNKVVFFVVGFFLYKLGSLDRGKEKGDYFKEKALFFLNSKIGNDYIKYLGLSFLEYKLEKSDLPLIYQYLEYPRFFVVKKAYYLLDLLDHKLAFIEIQKTFLNRDEAFWLNQGLELLQSLSWDEEILNFILKKIDFSSSNEKERFLNVLINKLDSSNVVSFITILSQHPSWDKDAIGEVKKAVSELWKIDEIKNREKTQIISVNDDAKKKKIISSQKQSATPKVKTSRKTDSINNNRKKSVIFTSPIGINQKDKEGFPREKVTNRKKSVSPKIEKTFQEKILENKTTIIGVAGGIFLIFILFLFFNGSNSVMKNNNVAIFQVSEANLKNEKNYNLDRKRKKYGSDNKISKDAVIKGILRKIVKTPQKRTMLIIDATDGTKYVIYLDNQLIGKNLVEGNKIVIKGIYSKTDALGIDWYYGK